MNTKVVGMIDLVIPDLEMENSISFEPEIYDAILAQLIFLKDCYQSNKDFVKELNARKFNFGVIASRNLSGPDDELEKRLARYMCIL